MSPLFTGHNRIELTHTPSTNRLAWDLLKEKPPEGTLVLAQHQTAGRGQRGTVWYSTEGCNLVFSIIYYPVFIASRDIFRLSKLVCVALQEVVSSLLPGREVRIKWPNDLWVEGKKVAGILIENQFEGAALKATVIGIGLNVNEVDFPPDLADRATSLKLAAGKDFDTGAVLTQTLAALEGRYLQLRAGHSARLDQDYYTHLLGYQESLEMEAEGVQFTGEILGVDASGRLAVNDGERVRYFDVKEVRVVERE